MGWEDRHGNTYYYRKRRDGKRVISEYVGNGFIGQMAEAMDREERAGNRQARANWQMEKESVRVIDNGLNEIECRVRAFTRAFLLISGYHPHKRQWRRKRNG